MIEKAIKDFVCELAYMNPEELSDDAPLFTSSIIDSASLIELVCFVEKRFNIKVSPGQISLENFDSISRIAAFIRNSSQ